MTLCCRQRSEYMGCCDNNAAYNILFVSLYLFARALQSTSGRVSTSKARDPEVKSRLPPIELYY